MSRRRPSILSDPPTGSLYAMLGLLLWVSCQQAPSMGSGVVVRVDGEEIAYEVFEAELRESVEGSELSLESSVLSRLFDQFLDDRLLVRLAVDKGLRAEPDERQSIEYLLREVDESAVGMQEIEAFYGDNRGRYQRPERVHLRQILVADRPAAEAAKEALSQGEDFADVAARFSSEPNARLGGDQGQLGREDLPASFVEIIFSLPEGGISDIVEADYGLHIFQAAAYLPAEVVPLEQVEEDIRRILLSRIVDEIVEGFVAEARERYNVRVFPMNFPFDYEGYYASQSDE